MDLLISHNLALSPCSSSSIFRVVTPSWWKPSMHHKHPDLSHPALHPSTVLLSAFTSSIPQEKSRNFTRQGQTINQYRHLPELERQPDESASLASQTFSSKCLPAAHWPCYKGSYRGRAAGFSQEHLSNPKIRWGRDGRKQKKIELVEWIVNWG